MRIVVTDTGPLLHLHQIGASVLLAQLGVVQVTPTVWSELLRHAPSFAVEGTATWLIISQPSASAIIQATRWVNSQMLHAGEAEALAFAKESHADIFLTDDTAARTLGESLGLQVRGSLGVVLFAAVSGHLKHAECSQMLDALEKHSTLWMSEKVKIAARNALTKIFEKH